MAPGALSPAGRDVCSYIVKRTQIYLDEGQAARLDERAGADGTTRSELIRRAVDAYLGQPPEAEEWRARWKAAIEATAGIAPYLPPGEEYVVELHKADRERQEELDRRWRR